MKKTLVVSLLMCSAIGYAQEITTCRSPQGRAYFHNAGIIAPLAAGWSDDKITAGVYTLTRVGNGFDVLYVDARKKPVSAAQDGGKIILLQGGPSSITILVHYGVATEVFTFFVENDGKSKFTMFNSRAGADNGVQKSSLMVGNCDPIRFDLLK